MAEVCDDKNCPVHGSISVRGMTKEGIIVSDKAKKTVSIEIDTIKYFPKYKRRAKSKQRISAHNPECMGGVAGDKVRIGETRKLSKTKALVVLEVLEKGEKK